MATLRFFWNSPQGTAPAATGQQGFYYHFLDMQTGRRIWNCELSIIDTTFLLAGALAAAMYFNHDMQDESEIRNLADALYRLTDWRWAQNHGTDGYARMEARERLFEISLGRLRRGSASLCARTGIADPWVTPQDGVESDLTAPGTAVFTGRYDQIHPTTDAPGVGSMPQVRLRRK